MKIQKNYNAVLASNVIFVTASNEYQFNLSIEPAGEMGWIILDHGGGNEEEIFYHRKEGTSVFVYPINRGSTYTHLTGTKALLANSVAYLNYLFDMVHDFSLIYKKTANHIIVKGGSITINGIPYTVTDLDTSLSIPGKILASNVVNYIYLSQTDGEYTIKQSPVTNEFLIGKVTTDVSGLITSIVKNKIVPFAKGVKGDIGIGISNVSQTKSGITNTITITKTDGTTESFTVNDGDIGPIGLQGDPGEDGVGIENIVVDKVGKTTTMTVTRTNGVTMSFIVLDGADGVQGPQGIPGEKGEPGADGVGVASVNASKTGKTTTVSVNLTNATSKAFDIEDGSDGVGIQSVSSSKVGKTTTVSIEKTDASVHVFNIEDGVDGTGTGDMLTSIYDTNGDGKVNSADTADTATTASSVPWSGVTDKPSTYAPSTHTHTIANVTNLQTTLNAKANDANVVHKTGDEAISGLKSFGAIRVGMGEGGVPTGSRAASIEMFGKDTSGNGGVHWTKFVDADGAIIGDTTYSLWGYPHKSDGSVADYREFYRAYFKDFNRSTGVHNGAFMGFKVPINTSDISLIGSNGSAWWGAQLHFMKDATSNAGWYIGGRNDQQQGLLFEYNDGTTPSSAMMIKPKGELSLTSTTDWGTTHRFKIGTRYAISGIPHASGGHQTQFLWGGSVSDPEGSYNDGGWGLLFGSASNPYMHMYSNNVAIGRSDGYVYIGGKLPIVSEDNNFNKMRRMTQANYDSLGSKDPNTIYLTY